MQAAAGTEVIADWLRLAGSLPGIGSATVERMEATLPLTGDFRGCLALTELPQAAGRALAELDRALQRFREAGRSGLSARPGRDDALSRNRPGAARTARRLLELAGSFGIDLAAFGHHLRRYAEAAVYDERAEAVALMTLHSAKGLEFPVVFLAGAEEGLLPCSLWNDVDVEEERRLCYVGVTRAKERLILSASNNRPWVGPSPRPLSRFIGEMPAKLLSRCRRRSTQKGERAGRARSRRKLF